jgi:hypothetical protein
MPNVIKTFNASFPSAGPRNRGFAIYRNLWAEGSANRGS